MPVLAWVGALATIVIAVRPVRGSGRAIGALLAVAWLWTGYGYHYLHFATINFVAPLYAGLFVLQGLLLLWTGLIRGSLAVRFRAGLFGWAGLALALAALAAGPLADWLFAQDWRSVRVVGLAPAPTTVFTLGLLLLSQGRTPLHLSVIPFLWTLIAGATGWILAIPQDLVLPAAGLGGFALMVWKKRRQTRR